MENRVSKIKALLKRWRSKKTDNPADLNSTYELERHTVSAAKSLPQHQQVLFDYFYSLPTDTALHPHHLKIEDTMMANTESNFKEILWESIIGHDILSLCRWDSTGLRLRRENDLSSRIENQKRFITVVYFAVKRLWFDFIPFVYATNLKKRLAEITETMDQLDAIEQAIGISPKPRKESVIKTKNFIKTRVNNIYDNLDFKMITNLPLWRNEKKQAEEAAVKMLYDCISLYCPSCETIDIYHNIAKVTLLFGTSQHYKNDLTPTELRKETTRVRDIHQPFIT